MHPKTIERNYKQVKEKGGDFYFNNRKGRAGRPKAISDEDVEEAVRRIDAGELINGEDVRREMLPNNTSRTVRDTALLIFWSDDA
jgi:hypothetical protein